MTNNKSDHLPAVSTAEQGGGSREIEFTQYLLPDGRKSTIHIARPESVAANAEIIRKRGFRFEAEILTTGEVSLTAFDPEKETTVAIEVIPNGPEVPLAVDRLVDAALSKATGGQA